MRHLLHLTAALCVLAPAVAAQDPWIVFEGKEGPGVGKHIVLVTGDDEYRSEEGMPMLAEILAERHGFKCTVLFAIDPADGTIKPDFQKNIPGTPLLADADLMVLFLRFRDLPPEQMKPIIDFVENGGPVVALRTSTHAFNIIDPSSPYAGFSWSSKDPVGGFGQLVLGDTWVSHHGEHGKQSTHGVINPKLADHPILRGVKDVWGPTDVYGITHLPQDVEVLMLGQVLSGMMPNDPPASGSVNDPMMPLVWTREYVGKAGKPSRVTATTMGASVDLENEGLRRLLVNAIYFGVGLADQIPEKAAVDYVRPYHPSFFGFGTHKKGVRPADLRAPR